jgi:hypothetical protein
MKKIFQIIPNKKLSMTSIKFLIKGLFSETKQKQKPEVITETPNLDFKSMYEQMKAKIELYGNNNNDER